MYGMLKTILIRIMPARWLRFSEPVLRRVFSWFLTGNRVSCNLCGIKLSRFIRLPSGDLLCPACGSLPRQRRLWEIVREMITSRPGIRVLHLSPSRKLSEKIRERAGGHYTTSTADLMERADTHIDITSTAADEGPYDLIICYHILEHVREDRKAMRELFQITAPGGMLLVQSPLRPGSTYENDTVQSPLERKLHFGQDDHLRIYGREDLRCRLENAGWQVRSVLYTGDERKGLTEGETVLFCTRS